MTQTSPGRIRLIRLVQESRSSEPAAAKAARAELDRLTVQFHTLKRSGVESR